MDGLPLSEITNNDLSLAHSMPPGAVHTNNSDAGGEVSGRLVPGVVTAPASVRER
jgi:hypothetical protein